MKRRTFIRNSSIVTATSFLIPSMRCSRNQSPTAFQSLDSLQLTDFDDEQDESPRLLQNQSKTFLTTLRRREYPADTEVITWFEREGEEWVEQSPVTAEPGAYEAISADCHWDGEPAVVWTEIVNEQWLIKAAVREGNGFSRPATISDPAKRSINPVIKAVTAQSYAVAWESFEEGRFCLYVSTYADGRWSSPRLVTDPSKNSFDPAIEQDADGAIYIAYDIADGCHRNIEMRILRKGGEVATVPIAIGGAFEDRVNINVKPALAFDEAGKLWISWENNRDAHRLQDGDNYTGDRCCAMVCYNDGELLEPKTTGRWLFRGKNDHWPHFTKDPKGRLYVTTHCGGDFEGNPFWKFRVSYLDPAKGWQEPKTLLETKQKGESIVPTIAFDPQAESFWLAWKSEQFKDRDYDNPGDYDATINRSRRGMLEINRFSAPEGSPQNESISLVPTTVEEHHPVEGFAPFLSGRPKSRRPTMEYRGETYTLLIGNFHEHSEISSCWPAGTDGTLHDDYRFGLTSEGYDFMGITDHGYSQTEVYWRKHLRLADFYNVNPAFVAFPSVEWTLSNNREFEIRPGAGHRNVLFQSTEEARKFIRNKDEVYSVNNPEAEDAPKLWQLIRDNDINCISIPHHPADEVHACCWETRDEEIEPLVEVFQCRGNAEYRGAPRMINLERHQPTDNDKGFIDYALRDKRYKLGFIASGDHNSIGVGLACIWVKDVSRAGIMEAMRERRVFGTTGDQMVVDFRIKDAFQGQTVRAAGTPQLTFAVEAVDDIERIDILRNSRVIKTMEPGTGTRSFAGEFTDTDFASEQDVLYYYVRAEQRNTHIAWSSPIWVEEG